MKFKLHDIRESKVWKEAHDEGKVEGKMEGKAEGKMEGAEEGRLIERQQTVRRCRANGMSETQIADLLGIGVVEIRRLAKLN